MAKLAIYSSAPLTATADPRVKEGLLLPFGEFGMTNKGKIKASAGSLKTAEKLDPLTLEHVDSLDAAEFVQIEERKEGLWCSIRYMNTPMGDAALAEFESGKRASLSVATLRRRSATTEDAGGHQQQPTQVTSWLVGRRRTALTCGAWSASRLAYRCA